MAKIHIIKENESYIALVANREMTPWIHARLEADGFKLKSDSWLDENGCFWSCYKREGA